jgi:hypothetical protein
MVDAQCSNGFFVEKYKKSLMRTMNELPYDFEEIKKWFQDIEDVKKKRLEQLWNLSKECKESHFAFSDKLYDSLTNR